MFISAVSTCKLVAALVPGIIRPGVAGRGAVLLQVLLLVPALGLVKGVEEQGILLEARLQSEESVQGIRLTDNQRTYQN